MMDVVAGPGLVPWAAALAVALPVLGGAACFVVGGRTAAMLAWTVAGLTAVIGAVLLLTVAEAGPRLLALGGWAPPLGIAWRVDGLAAAAITLAGGIFTAVLAHAETSLVLLGGRGLADAFRPHALLLLGGLNALFLSNDVFNLYVTLELATLAAVGMVALHGEASAALRYLLVGMVGALAYLLGCGLLYAAFGGLDMDHLASALRPGPAAAGALALMIAGTMAKGALFPVHGWLPPAHGSAVAPASALLSGVVAKAGFYVLLRLWLDVVPAAGAGPALGQVLGGMGTLAVAWGSVQAIRQDRLKMLLAYSTIAQLGYLLIALPLIAAPAVTEPARAGALQLMASHACAKGAMFLAAGALIVATGHDRLADLKGAAHDHPMTAFTLGLGGLTLMGLPPSGGFLAKWLLVSASITSGQWWWAVALLAGSLFAAAYVFIAVSWAMSRPTAGAPPFVSRPIPRRMEAAALGLALASVALGLVSAEGLP